MPRASTGKRYFSDNNRYCIHFKIKCEQLRTFNSPKNLSMGFCALIWLPLKITSEGGLLKFVKVLSMVWFYTIVWPTAPQLFPNSKFSNIAIKGRTIARNFHETSHTVDDKYYLGALIIIVVYDYIFVKLTLCSLSQL